MYTKSFIVRLIRLQKNDLISNQRQKVLKLLYLIQKIMIVTSKFLTGKNDHSPLSGPQHRLSEQCTVWKVQILTHQKFLFSTSKCNFKYYLFSFFRLASGRNSANPAIWLVPGAGGILSYGLLQRSESIELIYFREWISGFRQSFALLFHFQRPLHVINASLTLITFRWQGKIQLKLWGFVVWLLVPRRCNGASSCMSLYNFK